MRAIEQIAIASDRSIKNTATGILERCLRGTIRELWEGHIDHIAQEYNTCPRVQTILAGAADKYAVKLDDLRHESWLKLRANLKAVLDDASNIYPLLEGYGNDCAKNIALGKTEATQIPAELGSKRKAGFLEEALERICPELWADNVEILARKYNECPRVRAILRSIADKHVVVDYDDLKQDTWLIFQAKILPILDEPCNVYSALYATGDNCARTISHGVKEHPLNLRPEDNPDEVAAKFIEASQINDTVPTEQVLLEHDKRKAQAIVRQLIEQYGWPKGMPRENSAYRTVGRPRKESYAVRMQAPFDSSKVMIKLNTSIGIDDISNHLHTSPAEVREAIRREQEMKEQQQDPRDALQPYARKLFDLRIKSHLPIEKFAIAIKIKVDTLRALFYGTWINEPLAKSLCEAARAHIKEMKADPVLDHVLKNSMTKIFGEWQAMLGVDEPLQAIKHVAQLTQRKYSTLVRWYRENRKPVDINQLVEMSKIMLQAKELLDAKRSKIPLRQKSASSTTEAVASSKMRKAHIRSKTSEQ